jgi:hypothetical protein
VPAIGPDAPLRIIDPDDVYTGSARAVAAVRRLALDRDADRAGVRIVGSVPLADPPDDQQDWGRYEAAVNAALEPLRLSCVCAYDGRDLPAAARTVIGRTHPLFRTAHGATPNPDYLDPVTFLRMSTPAPADPAQVAEMAAPDVTIPAIEDVYDLAGARGRRHGNASRPDRPGSVMAHVFPSPPRVPGFLIVKESAHHMVVPCCRYGKSRESLSPGDPPGAWRPADRAAGRWTGRPR